MYTFIHIYSNIIDAHFSQKILVHIFNKADIHFDQERWQDYKNDEYLDNYDEGSVAGLAFKGKCPSV